MEQGDYLWVYAKMEFKESVQDSLWIYYEWVTDEFLYTDSVLFQSARRNLMRLKWEFEADDIPMFITVKFNWKGRDWLFQEHFPVNSMHPTGGISFWKSRTPWFQEWIKSNDSIIVQNNSTELTYVYYYSHQFEPTRPPMAMRPASGGGALVIDSVFTIKAPQYFASDRKGLYFFQSDSSTTEGRSILVVDENYPEPREISELSEPLVYITTRNEFLNLKKDLTSKQALDKFWLSTLKSPDKARAAIKRFYQHIEVSNSLFTSYKEGWKTDRGLIYTVFGAPLMVLKSPTFETWTYQNATGEDLQFVFRKISNIFSNNHYELDKRSIL